MLEDFRNHDPSPTADERAWMASNPFAVALHVAALAGIAIAIGLAGSNMAEESPRPATVAAAAP
jgi:hypothetical protein